MPHGGLPAAAAASACVAATRGARWQLLHRAHMRHEPLLPPWRMVCTKLASTWASSTACCKPQSRLCYAAGCNAELAENEEVKVHTDSDYQSIR